IQTSAMFSELQKCPRNVLVCERSSFMNEKSRHDKHVSQHYFNYKVSARRYGCDGGVSGVEETGGWGWMGALTALCVLCDPGRFYALSYKTRIDQDDVVALLPLLILSVVKDTYEQLGLEGRPSQYYRVPLGLQVHGPGSKRYDRVLWALREKVPLKTDFLMACHMGTEAWSLPPCLSRYPWKELQASVDTQTLRDLPCPVLHGDDLRGETACEPHAFLEWLGAVAFVICSENEATSFLSTYECPEPRTLVDQAVLCTVTGLLLPEDIHSLLEELRRYFDQPKSSSWLSLVVHGFADSPISWGMAEHGFHKGGENFYSFVLFKNQDYWLHMGTGANDGCPP
uniref:Ribonuclease P/MRP 40 subunit n=1 Tax=Scleropages formosus TaxID=113540 RepID=A0A8C9TPG2_SCLFO